MTRAEPAALARAIVDEHLYMVLATADADGRPWASPVYYAPLRYRELFWVSSPSARHSRNLANRPEVGIVVFDSRQEIGTGQGVYFEAVAEELGGAERERGLAVFSARSLEHGGREWTLAMIEPPARHRLYRAAATAFYILDRDDSRLPVEL